MTIPTFSPLAPPDAKAQVSVAPTVVESKFGDGYTQRAGNGINGDMRQYAPKWTNMTAAEFNYVHDFLTPLKGYMPFYWTPPGELTQKCFVCKTFNYSKASGDFADLSATFTQTAPVS